MTECYTRRFRADEEETEEERKKREEEEANKGLSTGAIIGIIVGIIVVAGLGIFVYIKFKPSKSSPYSSEENASQAQIGQKLSSCLQEAETQAQIQMCNNVAKANAGMISEIYGTRFLNYR